MKTSATGRALITQREGCRLTAYRDSKGIPTIGVGHVNMTPPVTRMGMTITAAQADAMLAADLAPVEAVINGTVKVPLSQNEFDALVSLGFNIGAAGLKRSSVLKKLNLGDVNGAAEAFMAWSKPAVLTARRREEKTQFLAPDRNAAGGTLPAVAPRGRRRFRQGPRRRKSTPAPLSPRVRWPSSRARPSRRRYNPIILRPSGSPLSPWLSASAPRFLRCSARARHGHWRSTRSDSVPANPSSRRAWISSNP